LDPSQADARDALSELESEESFLPVDIMVLAPELTSRSWRERRDAAAGLADLATKDPGMVLSYTSLLVDLLADEEREVRLPAILALGQIGESSAVDPLIELQESSWLLRFSIIEALSRLGSVDGLVTRLRGEMERIQDRNPVFSSHRDPLVEVEYDRLMEIGVLALERTGSLEDLVELAEANAWEDADEENSESAGDDWQADELVDGYLEDEEDEPEEDLTSYVDETALMVAYALERMAKPRLTALEAALLRRLAEIPDLTLLDLSEETGEEELTVVYDFSSLREAAIIELSKTP
jgi:hypothetical protein